MRLKSIALIIFVSLALIVLDRFGTLVGAKKVFGIVFEPLQIGFSRSARKVSDELSTIWEVGKLRDRNRELEYNNAILAAENTVLKKVQEENKTLKDQLDIKIKDRKLVMVENIGFSTIGSSKYLMIDKGSDDGIKKDQLVILKDILIGKINAVTPTSANVMLLTDPDFKIPSITSNKTKGLLVGSYQKEMRLTKILPEDKVEVGEMVISSGEAGYPLGLVAGKIDQVNKNDKDLFQEAIVKPLINLEKTQALFVLQ